MDAKLRRIADYFLAAKDVGAVNPKAVGTALLPYLFVLDVERQTPEAQTSGAKPTLRIRLTGTEIQNAFRRALEGRHLEEFLHGPHGGDVIAGFHECADTHVPLWMRQVVRLPGRAPRCVEGVAIYLAPDRIYGGLVVGETSLHDCNESFEKEYLPMPA